MTRRRAAAALSSFLVATLVASHALAGGDGGEASFATPMWQAVNLVILIGLIVHFGGAGIKRAMKNRASTVAKSIEDASALYDEAKGKLDEYEAKLNELDAKREEILADFRAQGEAEKARLIEAGSSEADRIRSEAKRTADSELRRARQKLESEMVDLAVSAASKLLTEKMSAADRQKLNTDYLARLEEDLKA